MLSTTTKLALAALALLAAGAGAIYLGPGSAGDAIAVLRPKRAAPPTPLDWPAHVGVAAGDGVAGAVDGPARQARFADPFGVAVDAAGNVYLAEGGENNRIRKISAAGVVSTLAGGREGFADGAGAAAAFTPARPSRAM